MARQIRINPYIGSRYIRAEQNPSVQALQSQFREQIKGITGALEEFISELNDVVPDILVEALEPTFGKALEYCPEKTGALRESGYLEVESSEKGLRGNTQHVIAIGFGKGGQPSYAIYVHELPYNHVEPTRSKFLEAALDEDYYTILNEIPRLIRESAGT